MGNLKVNVGNLGPAGVGSRSFEANTKPLETSTLGINLDASNDFSVPLRFGQGAEAKTVYLRPDQVDGIKMALAGASRNEAINGGGNSVTVNVGGQNLSMTAQEMQAQLSGRGVLTAGS